MSSNLADLRSCVDEQALKKLETNNLVCDSIINYHFGILEEREKAKGDRYCFVQPGSAFVIQNFDINNLRQQFKEVDFLKYSYIFFPITRVTNDVTQNHFSLIFWHRKKNRFIHLDSAGNKNTDLAKSFVSKVNRWLKVKGKFSTAQCPLQTNSVDCGIYVMALSDYISKHNTLNSSLSEFITPQYISKYRELLARFIRNPEEFNNDWENVLNDIEKSLSLIKSSAEQA